MVAKSLELCSELQHKVMGRENNADDEWDTTSDHGLEDVDLGGKPNVLAWTYTNDFKVMCFAYGRWRNH